jgi:hypothetical protein
MMPSLTKLTKKTTFDAFDDLPEAIINLIVEELAKMGCNNKNYPALCSTTKEYRKICTDESLWEQKCADKGWTVGEYARPSPMRSWFAHYMINYCGPYIGRVNKMLEDAAARGDVQRVAAALASGANPTRHERPLRYAVGSFQPNLYEYAKNKGDMIGVVKLILQYGPPPAYAMREALSTALVENQPDEDANSLDDGKYNMLYNEYVAAPSFTVASILLDYINAKQYRLWDHERGQQYFYRKMVGSILRKTPFAPERLRLLVNKRPFLVDTNYTKEQDGPYQIAIEADKQDRYKRVRTLLDLQFPTTLPLDQDNTYNRYATITAALEGDCEILGLLKNQGAAFPSLNAEEVEQLLDAIKRRRQEKQEESEEESDEEQAEDQVCVMESYLRDKGLI